MWMSIGEYAKRYNLKAKTLWANVKAGKKGIVAKQFGKLWRIYDDGKSKGN